MEEMGVTNRPAPRLSGRLRHRCCTAMVRTSRCVYIHVHIRTYTHIYVYVYIYTCVYIHICDGWMLTHIIILVRIIELSVMIII